MQSRSQQEAAWAAAVAARDTALAVEASAIVSTALVLKPIVSGVKNGVNKAFIYSGIPVMIYLNGMCLCSGLDYVQNEAQVTFTDAPQVTDILIAY